MISGIFNTVHSLFSKDFFVIYLCGEFPRNPNNPETACLLMWLPQAPGSHCFHIRNQSFPPVFNLVRHDVMATRQQGDELRVMDICIGTFPFPRQPLFTLKALHIIHQYCPTSQALYLCTSQTHMWRHFLPPHPLHCLDAPQPIRFGEIR